MKQFLIIVVYIFVGGNVKAQHHDVTTGTVAPIINRYLFSYEYVNESDKGFGMQLSFGKPNEMYKILFALTPFYRSYYGEDGNLMFTEIFVKVAHYNDVESTGVNTTAVGPGVGIGWKFKIVNKILLGLNFGVGYFISKYPVDMFAYRGSLFAGYRF